MDSGNEIKIIIIYTKELTEMNGEPAVCVLAVILCNLGVVSVGVEN